MKHPASAQNLAGWLREALQAGIYIEDELRAFMRTTFGTAELSVLLTDPDSAEAASFLELLFYPNQELRNAFEARWGRYLFSAADQAAVSDALTHPPLVLPLFEARDREPILFQPPDFAVDSFVQHLNIAWQSPPSLRQLLDAQLKGRQRSDMRAILRHAKMAWHTGQIALFALFLQHQPESTDAAESGSLAFLLGLLPEMAPASEPFAFLTAQKQRCFQALCKAEAFERRRKTHNMETLMLQGARDACGSIAQWQERMRQIDHLCRTLFGSTRFFHQLSENHLEIHPSADAGGVDLSAIWRLLD